MKRIQNQKSHFKDNILVENAHLYEHTSYFRFNNPKLLSDSSKIIKSTDGIDYKATQLTDADTQIPPEDQFQVWVIVPKKTDRLNASAFFKRNTVWPDGRLVATHELVLSPSVDPFTIGTLEKSFLYRNIVYGALNIWLLVSLLIFRSKPSTSIIATEPKNTTTETKILPPPTIPDETPRPNKQTIPWKPLLTSVIFVVVAVNSALWLSISICEWAWTKVWWISWPVYILSCAAGIAAMFRIMIVITHKITPINKLYAMPVASIFVLIFYTPIPCNLAHRPLTNLVSIHNTIALEALNNAEMVRFSDAKALHHEKTSISTFVFGKKRTQKTIKLTPLVPIDAPEHNPNTNIYAADLEESLTSQSYFCRAYPSESKLIFELCLPPHERETLHFWAQFTILTFLHGTLLVGIFLIFQETRKPR